MLGAPARVLEGTEAGSDLSSRKVVSPVAVESGAAPEGEVLFLDASYSAETAGTLWRFRRVAAAGPVIERRLDPRGVGRVPVGKWAVEALDPGWVAPTREVLVVEGLRRPVWVTRSYSIEVHAYGWTRPGREVAGGTVPLGGALVRWLPDRPGASRPWPEWLPLVGGEWLTQEDGVARLAGLGDAAGRIVVLLDGYVAATQWLSGGRERSLEFFLHPTEGRIPTSVVLVDTNGAPVPGVEALSPLGRVGPPSDGAGVLQLPSWLPDDTLLLRGGGVMPVEVPSHCLGAGSIELALESRVTLSLERAPTAGESAWALIDVGDLSPCSGEPVVPPCLLFTGGQAEVSLPRGVASRVFAFSGREGGARTFTPRSPREEVVLTLSALRHPLEITVAGVDGDQRVTISGRYAYRRLVEVEVNGPGSAVLPRAAELTRVDVRSRGYVPVRLRPVWNTVDRGGEVDVPLEPARSLGVHVVDSRGDPVAGVQLGFVIGPGHPPLQVGHPSWEAEVIGSPPVVTDAAGDARVDGLRLGEYHVFVALPDGAYGAAGVTFDPSSIGPLRVLVDDSGRARLTIPASRWCRIEGVDGESGFPVDGLVLSSAASRPSEIIEISARAWEGRLPESWNPLLVSSPGYGAVRLENPLSREEWRVVLEPIQPYVLRLGGEARELQGFSLTVEAVRRIGPRGAGWYSPIQRVKTTAVTDGQASFRLPLREDVLLHVLDCETPGGTWTFHPRYAEWTGEGATVQATRVP